MQLINWNVEWAGPRRRKTPEILKRIERRKPEIVCLTETHPDLLSGAGHAIYSKADYGYRVSRGRKILLWSARP